MESTLKILLNSLEGKKFKNYEFFNTYRQEVWYIYKRRLTNETTTFPRNFWVGNDGLINSRIIIDYIILFILRKKIEDIPKIINNNFFRTHKISGLRRQHTGIIDLLMTIYPGMFDFYDFKIKSRNIWDREDKFEVAEKLIRHNMEKYKYTKNDIYNVNWGFFFNHYGMGNMYQKLFKGNVIEALNFIFKGDPVIRIEDIRQLGKWSDDKVCFNVIDAVLKSLDKRIDNLYLNDIKKLGYMSIVVRV